MILFSMALLSCGYVVTIDESTTQTDDSTETAEGEGGPPEAPVLELSLSQVKQFDFQWMPAPGAQYYQLLERFDTSTPYVQVGDNVLELATSLTVPLHSRLAASYKLRACNDAGCTDSAEVAVAGPLVEAIGYFKATNSDAHDRFGASVSLSQDGNTLAVGAAWEDSSATGIDGDQADGSISSAGAVYVFIRDGQGAWSQQAYVKASNSDAGDAFGHSVALSGDGNTLAVGANNEDSGAAGIDGDQADGSTDAAGAVYVFVRDEQGAWSQQAYVKASNPDKSDLFGSSVALSGDGNTLAVGAIWEDSAATGIDNNQADNLLMAWETGAVYVFVRNGQHAWSQQAYVKASNTDVIDLFGCSVALSSDGNTLAVGAENEASSARGIGGDEADNSAFAAGAVYIFVRNSEDTWSQQAYVKASNTDAGDSFGRSVALSGDGNTLAVGAFEEDSSAIGFEGNEADDSTLDAGAVYVFVRDGPSSWLQQTYVKASNTDAEDAFGRSVALSGDGNTLAVSAALEDSSATGLEDDQADSTVDAGAVYVFVRNDQSAWPQQAYVKASNTETNDLFGRSVALSGDGSTLAVGAYNEASGATGIGGDQADNAALGAGAVYLY